jgi:hypothetical protein
MSEIEIIFCCEENPDSYGWFLHEADVLLLSLASMVGGGAMTADEARDEWKAYREFWPAIYDEDEYGPSEFPDPDTALDVLPASSDFWQKASRLNIPGVGFSRDVSPASGEIFEVHGDGALETLKDRLRGDYRVIVMDHSALYAGGWEPEEAREHIERAREEQAND